MKRRVIVTCTPEIADLLKAGKALGATYVDAREVFERNEVEVRLESPEFVETPPSCFFPRALLEANPDGTFRVIPVVGGDE